MKESKNTSYNNSFLYPINGAGSFIKILHDNLDKEKILLNTEIVSIDEEKRIAKTNNGEEIEYEYLINSIPLNQFLPLFNNEEYNKLKDELSYNKVLVFNLGFNKKSPLCTKEHWLYIPDKECNYYRIGFYDNILNADKLSMYIEIGYSKEDTITQEEIDKQLELTLLNLKKQKIIDDTFELVDYVSIIMNPAYVHIEKETSEKINKLFDKFSNDGIYSIGRYGGWTYCSMEDCMLEAKELCKKL